jgi:hypothetical protein
LSIREITEVLNMRRLVAGGLGFKPGELGRDGEILLLSERETLLSVDVGGINFSADGVEFFEEAAYVGVGFCGYGGGVAG